jgi:hypothetical protein
MRTRIWIVCTLFLFLGAMGPATAYAQGSEEDVEETLSDLGLAEPQVTIGETDVLVEYRQTVSEMGEVRKNWRRSPALSSSSPRRSPPS